jgi:hypothetical protein
MAEYTRIAATDMCATVAEIVGSGVFYAVRPDGIFRGLSGKAGSDPCGGGVEYLHRDPASRRRRRKGKSQI